ncbi:MAG: DUF4349 domain-containing protein, partial [Dehalococcoidia bacterium]|nr:DUF4349 domain-containing protein [Dehalococcoidia bacterium]
MKVTRTRIIVVGAIVALLAAGAVIGLTTQGSDESAEEGAISSTLSLENDGELPAPAGDAAAPAAPLAEGAPASAGADGSEASLAPALELQGLLDRKIVTSASIDLEVEEVGRNFQDIVRIAGASGGFVASSSFSNVEDDQIADLTVRVPADRYQDVLGQIRKLGDVKVEG